METGKLYSAESHCPSSTSWSIKFFVRGNSVLKTSLCAQTNAKTGGMGSGLTREGKFSCLTEIFVRVTEHIFQ